MNNTQQPSPRQHLPAFGNNSTQDFTSLHRHRYRKRNQSQNTDHQNVSPSWPSSGQPCLHRRVNSHSSLHGASQFHVPSQQNTPSGSLMNSELTRYLFPRTRWHDDASLSDTSVDVPSFTQDDLSSPDSTENYRELLRVAEMLAKPRGLVGSESLYSYQFNKDTHQGDQMSCVVCMCEFEESQLLRELPCFHEYHAECIDEWFMSHTTCPICRRDAKNYSTTSD